MQSFFRALSHRAIFMFAGVTLSLAFVATGAQASCPQRSTLELLNFALANAPSDFAAIRGSGTPGGQYDLTPTAERFCPHHFILQNNAATSTRRETWVLRFSVGSPASESDDDIANGVFTQFSPVLKSDGFSYGGYQNGETGLELSWSGPSNMSVFVATYAADEDSTDAGFEVYVQHTVK